MIVGEVRGNVLNAPQKHIAFAVNTGGNNDAGFAGRLSSLIWPELASTGGNRLGEVLTRKVGGRTYHALVCHSIAKGGWRETPRVVRECLDKLAVPDDEEIAVVLMGSGMLGALLGANLKSIIAALKKSKKRLVIYSL